MYEKYHHELLTVRRFIRRLAIHFALAGGVIIIALAIGMGGYAYIDDRSLSEAFVHAAAPIAGMGVTHVPDHTAGQIFTGVYAILASFTFVFVSAIVYAPLLHRILHAFHLRGDDLEGADDDEAKG